MSAIGDVHAALKAFIAADAGVTDLLAVAPAALGGGPAIYDDGAAPEPTKLTPMSTLTPWLTVGAWTAVRVSRFGAHGWNCTGQLKVSGQITEAAGQAIVKALAGLLFPGAPVYLTVPGWPSSWVDDFAPQPALVEPIGGIVTRSWPVIVRVYAT